MAINTYFKNIADAIREKTGGSAFITPGQMPEEILNIISGGIESIEPLHKNLTNGYISGSSFRADNNSNYNNYIFKLTESVPYIFINSNGTNRFRFAYFNEDIYNATADVSGYSCFTQDSTNQYHSMIVNMTDRMKNKYFYVYQGDVTALKAQVKVFKMSDLFEG